MPSHPRIRIRRIYEAPGADEGYRVLVDRVWPRGISKEKAGIDAWDRDLAPSTALRKWFGHEPSRWKEFALRYRSELAGKTERLHELLRAAGSRDLTLLYGARDTEHNQAVVLREALVDLATGARTLSATD
ncbi:DUF488 domain-containing protein [Methylacidimicrobium sp. B4]|uniref:DUF488 domain-containing protein n=1 Tax=Methylacidimicrobium sp. B4 TaxID=2796139 RepID=UPI001A8FCE88|nr:DUF488 domain-containing protein [Methylacidimicrobium sp. B4]QSR85489.1 DUF488 domain-containing protein [Methylacidimicrobium sp. B4]